MTPTREEVIRVALEVVGDYRKDDYWPFFVEELERLAQHFYEAGAAAAREPLQKDAARYRWLTDDHGDAETRNRAEDIGIRLRWVGKGAADAAIDAAIAEATGEKT